MADDYRVSYTTGMMKQAAPTIASLGSRSSLTALSAVPALSPSPARVPQKMPQGYMTGGWPIPQMNAALTFRDIGTSGLRQYGGWVREEFLPQLSGRQAARTFREMMDNSSTIGAAMFAVIASMRKVEWRTEPADDTPAAQEMADFVDSCRDDMSHTWSDFVIEMLSMLGYGFAPMEIVYKRRNGRAPGTDPGNPGRDLPKSKYDDGLVGWRRLPLRGQDTVIKWFFGESNEILGMTQQPWIGPLVDIPIEKMLLFRPHQRKNNPEGSSILRTAYRSWFLAKRLEEQEAILFERISGLPVVKVPNELFDLASSGNSDAVAKLAAFKNIALNLRIDEQMGVVLPSDCWPGAGGAPSSQPMYSLELITPASTRSGANSDQIIQRYNLNILTSILADFLQLGHGARGTQSLAVSKTDMFFQAIEGYLNSSADVLNRYALPRLWDLNGLDHDLAPEITPDLAVRLDLDVLSNFILRMSQSGMPLFPDPELEQWVRDAAGLPDVTEEGAARAMMLGQIGVPQGGADPSLSPEDQAGKTPQQQGTEAMVKAAIVRRLLKMNGATGSTKKAKAVRKSNGRYRMTAEYTRPGTAAGATAEAVA